MILQITIRGFYTCKHGSVSPSITIEANNPSGQLDISKVLKELTDMAKDLPGPLREMTQEEVDAYLASEEDDQP